MNLEVEMLVRNSLVFNLLFHCQGIVEIHHISSLTKPLIELLQVETLVRECVLSSNLGLFISFNSYRLTLVVMIF